MQGDVHGDSVFVVESEIGQGPGFGLGEGLRAAERLPTRMPGSAALQTPLVVEVAVDVGADARMILGVLPPQHGTAQLLQNGVVQVGILLEARQTILHLSNINQVNPFFNDNI